MMGLWIWEALGISLSLTIALEFLFAVLVGIRNKKDLLLLILVNILTNPPTVLIYYLLAFYTSWNKWLIQIPLEILVIFVEATYYKSYGKEFRRPFLFSLLANMFSYGIGIILNIVFS